MANVFLVSCHWLLSCNWTPPQPAGTQNPMSGKNLPFSRALLAGLCLALPLCIAPARAAPPVKGPGLMVRTPCLQSLHIVSKAGQAEPVHLEPGFPADITRAIAPDGTITLAQKNCSRRGSLTVSTRPDIPLTIEDAGSTNIVVEDRTGTVFIHAGSGTLALGRTGELGLVSQSSGPITISTLSDSARIRSEQSAPVTITRINAPALALYLGGSASFTAGSGQLQALEITSRSTGNAVFHGVTDVGLFHVEQSGAISVDKVTGALATERDGSGKIISDAAAPAPRTHADKVNVLP